MKSRGSNSNSQYACATCGKDPSVLEPGEHSSGVWRGDVTVYHCEGQTHVLSAKYWGEAHHYISTYGNCWKCGRSVGCQICTGVEREILCENFAEHGDLGAVWATKMAFVEHGPIVIQRGRTLHGRWQDIRQQTLLDYPSDWAQEYEPMEVPPQASSFLNRLVTNLAKLMGRAAA